MPDDPFFQLSAEEKQQVQIERLQSTLNRACRHVPFHANRLGVLGMEPSDISALADIARLPFMERADFSEHYPYDLFAVPLRDIVRIHTAPGTTRNPTVSGYTAQDLDHWRHILGRALRTAGIGANDILQIALNPGLANWGRDYKDGAEAIGASVIPNTPLSVEKQLMVLRDYKTTVLITTPAMAGHLADYTVEKGIGPASLSLHTLVLCGEFIDPEFRNSIETGLHVRTWLHYGLSEIPGPAIAFECKAHDGLHIQEDHFLAEIIDPETREVLSPGSAGELVLTSLTTRAFPLIRFKTGDRARLLEDPCPCGSTLMRMKWDSERTDDIMNIDGVNVHGNQTGFHLKEMMGMDPRRVSYRVVHQQGRKVLEVLMEMNDAIFSDEIKELEQLLRRSENRLRENLGVPVTIRLVESKG
ncbi:phenylacetate-CoA ligase [Desulfosalsimonas propionicica]|uniref:Phenylacetate-CoA ligase n=2 Tax=Desulfosalsimonas propionicica TaxID=332175 RepID=A0A7W0HL44_9BACT|nr:phenylacetate-CoA ligase [Desulfosalsimonas propionicica]